MLRTFDPTLDQVEKQPRRHRAFLLYRLTHGGQGWERLGSNINVIEANHSQVFRDPDSSFVRCL